MEKVKHKWQDSTMQTGTQTKESDCEVHDMQYRIVWIRDDQHNAVRYPMTGSIWSVVVENSNKMDGSQNEGRGLEIVKKKMFNEHRKESTRIQ